MVEAWIVGARGSAWGTAWKWVWVDGEEVAVADLPAHSGIAAPEKVGCEAVPGSSPDTRDGLSKMLQ